MPLNLELIAPVTDTDLQLDLNLPVETQHEVNNRLFYSYTPDQFRVVLKIFKTYTVLAEAHILLLQDIEILEEQNEELFESLYVSVKTIHEVNNDREFMYKLRESDKKELEKDVTKQKLKTIFITGGSTIVGIAAGILIGIFAI